MTLPEDYALVWSDEFDEPGLPSEEWRYDTHRNAEGWYNEELQYYSGPRPENARVEDGNLVIETRREKLDKKRFPDWGGQSYTSARLLSPEQGWRYGFFEVNAKLPCGRGTWPAIWMLPSSDFSWPLGGEIDIMEHVAHDPGVINGTVHTAAYNHVLGTHKGDKIEEPTACTKFHRYQLLWTAEAIEIAIDGKRYFRFENDDAGDQESWPFDKPYHLLLNVAVGGSWGGEQGVDNSRFPQAMLVDYVRVYQQSASNQRP